MRIILPLVVLLVCACVLGKPFKMQGEVYDPTPSPNATVLFENVRVTLLTSSLLRLQCSRTTHFDDRPTFVVLNRNISPVPHAEVSKSNTTLTITTERLSLVYNKTRKGRSSCDSPSLGYDQLGGTRVAKYPDGYAATDQGDCCKTCDNTPGCTSWVFGTNIKKPNINCWLMRGSTGKIKTPNRNFGQSVGFCDGGLSITLINEKVTWTPDSIDNGNLNGTLSALDCYSTPTQCVDEFQKRMEKGILSRSGWYVLDDTAGYRFNSETPTPWYEHSSDDQDWYFFGYGHNYRKQLYDYSQIAGKITLPPLAAFGIWWSRYYTYSQDQFIKEVLNGYKDNGLPLHVIVLDMDWHIEPKDEKDCHGWGGFTWNTTLFANPIQFMNWVHSNNNPLGHPLKLSLNVHPQEGIDHCQDRYAEIAKIMGIDPATNKTVPVDMGNRTLVDTLYRVYYDAPLLQPVDWWWTDYGGSYGPPGKELLWSNYIYDNHIEVTRNIRPLVLSRYGGLGNHRYPIGFSGDSFQAFSHLQWEVEMTHTAANVLFGYWSHDIGGFQSGKECPGDGDPKNMTGSEMLMRWVQFGAISPIFRTHCDHCERRIWLFPYFNIMKDSFLFRNALVPYIYTAARNAYDNAISIVHPVYYDYPADQRAYQYTKQYMFGDHILASPITTLVDQKSGSINWPVWLPGNSRWSNWNGTYVYPGGQIVNVSYSRADIPLFVLEGSVIPMRTMASVSSHYVDPLMWTFFAGASRGYGNYYEDDGESLNYKNHDFSISTVTYEGSPDQNRMTIILHPAVGKTTTRTRGYILQLRGVKSTKVTATFNGKPIPAAKTAPGYYFNDQHSLTMAAGALIINLPNTLSILERVVIGISFN